MAEAARVSVGIVADTSALEAGLNKANGLISGFGGALSKVGALAFTGAVAGIGGVAAGLGGAVHAAAGFESTMSGVAAVTGATAEQMKQLSVAALQIGKDTSFSASEAAKGIEELAKAGVEIPEILGGAGRAVADLAAAGGVGLADAAEIASAAMNNFGKKGADMAGVADVIAGAVNASAIEMNDFKFSMSSVGAVAATVGVSFEDTAKAIALLGSAGIKGSDAGTSLKTMLLNLNPSTAAQRDLMRDLGLTTTNYAKASELAAKAGSAVLDPHADAFWGSLNEAVGKNILGVNDWSKATNAQRKEYDKLLQSSGAVSNQFFDQEGKVKDLASVSDVLSNALAGMNKQQKLATLETLFGSDAIRAAAVLADKGAEGFNKMGDAMSKVTAADVGAKRLDNLAGSVEKLKGSLETAAITLGLSMTPALKGVVDGFTDMVNNAIPAADKLAQAVGKLGGVFSGNLDDVQAALAGIGPLLSEAFGADVGSGITDALRQIGDAFRTMQSIMAGGEWHPSDMVDPFVNAVGTITVAFRDQAIPAMQAFGGLLTGTVFPALGVVAGALIEHRDLIAGLVAGYLALQTGLAIASGFVALSTAISGLSAVFTAASAAGGILAGVIAVLGGPVTIAIVAVAAAVALLTAAWIGNWGDIQGKTAAAVAFIQQAMGTVISVVQQVASVVGPALAQIGAAFESGGLAGGLSAMSGVLGQALNALSGLMSQGLGALADIAMQALAPVGEAIGGAFSAFGSTIQSALDGIGSVIQGAWDGFLGIIQGALSGIQGAINATWNAIPADIRADLELIAATLLERFGAMVASVVQWGTNTLAAIGAAWTAVTTATTAAWNAISTFLATTWQAILTAVTGALTPLVSAVQTSWTTAETATETAWTNVSTTIGTKVGEALTAVTTWAGNVLAVLSKLAGEALTEAGKIGQAILDGIGGAIDKGKAALGDKLAELARGALASAKAALGIQSPSSVFADQVGVPIVDGIVKGITDNAGKVATAVLGAVGGVLDAARNSGVGQALGGAASAVGGALRGAGAAIGNAAGFVKNNVGQFGVGLPADQAMAACGPYAALVFANAVGRFPTAQEAVQLARTVGWTEGSGMAGPGSEVNLLGKLGVNAVQQSATFANASAAIQAGSPVAFSTPKHYFAATGVDEAGRFNVGGTGTVFKGGKEWMTIEEMTALGGGMQSIIVLAGQMGPAVTTGVQQVTTAVGQMATAAGAAATQVQTPFQQFQAGLQPIIEQMATGTVKAGSYQEQLVGLANSVGLASEPFKHLFEGTADSRTALEQLAAKLGQTVNPAFTTLLGQLQSGEIGTNEFTARFLDMASKVSAAATTTGAAIGTVTNAVSSAVTAASAALPGGKATGTSTTGTAQVGTLQANASQFQSATFMGAGFTGAQFSAAVMDIQAATYGTATLGSMTVQTLNLPAAAPGVDANAVFSSAVEPLGALSGASGSAAGALSEFASSARSAKPGITDLGREAGRAGDELASLRNRISDLADKFEDLADSLSNVAQRTGA